jgi:hypothetical protein
MRVNFHPSSLLSIGDLLAFVREVSATASGTASQQQQQAVQQPELLKVGLPAEDWHGSSAGATGPSVGHPRTSAVAVGSSPLQPPDKERFAQLQQQQAPSRRPQVEAAPSIEQQMALAEGVTSRIPQR